MNLPRQEGFTIVELMVAIVLSVLVLATGYVYYAGSQRASIQSNEDSRMQDNARMAMDVLCRKFRMAGYLIEFSSFPGGQITDDGTTVSSRILPVNSTSGPDRVIMTGSFGGSFGTLKVDATMGATTIDVNGNHTALKDRVIAVSDHSSYYVTNAVYDGSTKTTLTLSSQLLSDFPLDTPVNDLSALTTFQVVDDADGTPVLRMKVGTSDQPLAENIEDFQVAYGVDLDNDGIVAGTEWKHAPPVAEVDQIRLARITIVSRTGHEIREFMGKKSPINAEDHDWGSPPKDGYGRFMLTRIVRTRNLVPPL